MNGKLPTTAFELGHLVLNHLRPFQVNLRRRELKALPRRNAEEVLADNSGKVAVFGHPLAEQVDGGQFCRKRGNIHAPNLAKQGGMILAAKPFEAVIGANEESACAARRVENIGVDRLDAEAENQVTKILWREVLAEPVPFFGRNQLLKDRADHVLGDIGEISGMKIVDQASKFP